MSLQWCVIITKARSLHQGHSLSMSLNQQTMTRPSSQPLLCAPPPQLCPQKLSITELLTVSTVLLVNIANSRSSHSVLQNKSTDKDEAATRNSLFLFFKTRLYYVHWCCPVFAWLSLDTSKCHLGRRTSIEKNVSIRLLVGKSVGAFSWLMIAVGDEGGTMPRNVASNCINKKGWASHKELVSEKFIHGLCFNSCFQVPTLNSCPYFPQWCVVT